MMGRKQSYIKMNETDVAYIAGLFDGEGSVYYKKLKQTRHNRPGKPVHNVWSIRMEIAMTEYSVLVWLTEVLGCGKLNPRKVKPGFKKQWRWRCTHRDAFHVACLLFPYAHVKLPGIQKIINHYSTVEKKNNIVDLDSDRRISELER